MHPLSSVQCRFETELRSRLMADEVVRRMVEEYTAASSLARLQKAMLKDAYRISPRTAPSIYHTLGVVDAQAQPGLDYEVYVEPSPMLNAWCALDPSGTHAVLGLSAGVVEKLGAEELTFIIGHEIGHLLFRHGHFPMQRVVENGRESLSPRDVLQLMAWGRYAEISADRIGLACCQSLPVACRTFFRLSSGVTGDKLGFDLDEYLSQLDAMTDLKTAAPDDLDDWFSTHPFNPLRVKALQLFSYSQSFRGLHGASDGWTLDAVEGELWRISSAMDPELIRTGSPVDQRNVYEFLALAGIAIATADGATADAEFEAIISIVGDQFFASVLGGYRASTDSWGAMSARLQELGDALLVEFSAIERCQLLQALLVVLTADGEVNEVEVDRLAELAMLLRLNQGLFDRVLSQLSGDVGKAM